MSLRAVQLGSGEASPELGPGTLSRALACSPVPCPQESLSYRKAGCVAAGGGGGGIFCFIARQHLQSFIPAGDTSVTFQITYLKSNVT